MAKKVKTIEFDGELRVGARVVIRSQRVDVISETEVKDCVTGEVLKVTKPSGKKEAAKEEE